MSRNAVRQALRNHPNYDTTISSPNSLQRSLTAEENQSSGDIGKGTPVQSNLPSFFRHEDGDEQG